MRFRSLVTQHAARQDKAGTFARRLEREGEALWVFLDVQGVEATNNIAERSPIRRAMAQTQSGDMQ
jgi:hypothetical protein